MRAERQHDRVVAGRRLQFEVERHAEPLAQREAEGAVDPTAIRRVDDEVHAVDLVEEPLEHQVVVRRHHPEHRPAGGDVADDLVDRGVVERCCRVQPGPGAVAVVDREEAVERGAQRRDLLGQLGGAGGRLAQPERDGGRLALGVDHPDDPGADLADLPRVGAEQEDVAGHRLGGPVLVDRADEQVVRLEDDPEVAARVFLAWVSERFGWDVHTGEEPGWSERCEAALGQYRQQAATHLDATLGEGKHMAEEDWRAAFTLMEEALRASLLDSPDGLEALRGQLSIPAHRRIGCGDRLSEQSGTESDPYEDRRVELVLLEDESFLPGDDVLPDYIYSRWVRRVRVPAPSRGALHLSLRAMPGYPVAAVPFMLEAEHHRGELASART